MAKHNHNVKGDVAIVGGGMVGLTLAIALGTSGLDVVVVDREAPDTATGAKFDGRASAIAFSSVRMLEALGIWREVRQHQPILDIRVSDGDSLLFLHYDHRQLGDTPMGQMVENRHFRQALFARLAALPNVRLLAPEEVKTADWRGARVQLQLQSGTEISAELCIAADGARSKLREQAGIGCAAWRYGQTGIVCTVHHKRPHHGVAHERFLPAGPFAILPLTGNRSSLVWTERQEQAPAILSLDEPDFLAELRLRFGDHLGELTVTGPRWSYPLGLHLADRYVDGRLALIGDAAHGIHPIAGQGLNLGLRDVAALAEVLVDARRLGLDLGQPWALDRYQRWRRFDALVLAVVTDALNRLFSNDLAPLQLARDVGLALVDRAPPLKQFFMRHAMGSMGNLPKLLRGEAL